MMVKCLATRGQALFARTREIGYNPESRFAPLEIGELYVVYGIQLWKGNLHYLVVPRYKGVDQGPSFDPAELFEVVDGQIPNGWYFRWEGSSDAEEATWGYRELLDPTHHDNLMERDPEALRIFKERKREMDRQLGAQ